MMSKEIFLKITAWKRCPKVLGAKSVVEQNRVKLMINDSKRHNDSDKITL